MTTSHAGAARRLEAAVLWAARGLAIVAALAIVVMGLAIALQVVVRATTGHSIPGMIEIAQSCLVVAIFLGLAWAGLHGEHVAVRVVTDRLSARTNRVLDLIIWSVSAVFLAWATWASGVRSISATGRNESGFSVAIYWPQWPWRWVIVIGFGALVAVCIVNVVRVIVGVPPYSEEYRASMDGGPAESGDRA